ncbi:DUF4010 domain-containing protein [Catalinimonas alkaloidigena]|uniref:DUF4010 domain-containing protein n=1 Tax=Catalinimonas alkaloidigena TaxID=1075417 RepID=UPI000B7D0F76|nr:DUF4010 domain-containing protein [Catalinimonas alkaloidigena]
MSLLVFSLFSSPITKADAGTGKPRPTKSAVVFGLVFALVLLATAAAREYLGNKGLYGVALISGLTDVDDYHHFHRPDGRWRTGRGFLYGRLAADFVGALANIAFKRGAVAILGGLSLLK